MERRRFPKIPQTLLIVFLGILLLGGGWIGFTYYQQTQDYRETGFLFDTEVYVQAHGWGAKKAALQALEAMKEIDARLNKFSADSELDLINQAAGLKPVVVSDWTFGVIQQAVQIAEMTQGAFDPTIGPLMAVWGFGSAGEQKIPTPEAVEIAKELVDYQNVILDSTKQTVYLSRKGMVLDLGGIAKGYAVDQAVSILKESNISSALVSAGGNIYTIGRKKDDSPWQIGVRDPSDKGKIVGYIQLENQAIDTSGDYERFFWADGKKYTHILDPRTGYPVQGVSGGTVIMPRAVQADALATAVIVLGAEKGLELIEQLNGLGLIIAADGRLVLSNKMEDVFNRM